MEPIKSVIVGEQVAGEAQKTRKAVEKLISAHILDQFDIGDLLWKIKKHGWYTNWGFNTFSEYGQTTGLKESKLRYLPQIVEVMEAVGFTREQYQVVGIAKLRAIAALKPSDTYTNPVTKDEVPVAKYIKDLVEKAIEDGDAFKLDDVKKYVRILQGRTGDRDTAFLRINTLRGILESVMRPALERAKAILGSQGKDDEGNSIDPSDAQAFAAICADYLASPAEGLAEASAEPEGESTYIEGVGELTPAEYYQHTHGHEDEGDAL
jgi:hypothetical protein